MRGCERLVCVCVCLYSCVCVCKCARHPCFPEVKISMCTSQGAKSRCAYEKQRRHTRTENYPSHNPKKRRRRRAAAGKVCVREWGLAVPAPVAARASTSRSLPGSQGAPRLSARTRCRLATRARAAPSGAPPPPAPVRGAPPGNRQCRK